MELATTKWNQRELNKNRTNRRRTIASIPTECNWMTEQMTVSVSGVRCLLSHSISGITRYTALRPWQQLTAHPTRLLARAQPLILPPIGIARRWIVVLAFFLTGTNQGLQRQTEETTQQVAWSVYIRRHDDGVESKSNASIWTWFGELTITGIYTTVIGYWEDDTDRSTP